MLLAPLPRPCCSKMSHLTTFTVRLHKKNFKMPGASKIRRVKVNIGGS